MRHTELQFLFWYLCIVSGVCMSSYDQWIIQRKPAKLVRIFDMFQQVGDCYSVKEIEINCTAVVEITNTDSRRSNYRLVHTTCSYFVCGKRHPLMNDPMWTEPLPNSPLECNNGGYVRYTQGDDSLSCICPKNFKGRFCDIPVCGDGCHHGGTCVQHYVSTKCLCPAGFTGEFCEKELKLERCNITRESHTNDSGGQRTCKNQYDCSTCETCCRIEDKHICIQRNKSKQVCFYFGKIYFSGDEFITSDGKKNCICIPQTLKFGFVRCSNTTNTIAENREPRITNCPTDTVIVGLDTKQNIGMIENNIIAKDWRGRNLPVILSTSYVKSCKCTDNRQNQFVIEATATDSYGNRARCEFVVETKDETPPIFTRCPSTIYALPNVPVSWSDPVAIDNVGIRTLVQLTSYKKKSIFPKGEHLISYIAHDWQGNNSKCQFFIVVDSLDNRFKHSL